MDIVDNKPEPDAMREVWSALARLRAMTPAEFKAYHSCIDLFEATLRALSAPAVGVTREAIARAIFKNRQHLSDEDVDRWFKIYADRPEGNDHFRMAIWRAYSDADAILALSPVPDATVSEPVAWQAFCPKTGGQMINPPATKDLLIERAASLYAEHGYILQPLYISPLDVEREATVSEKLSDLLPCPFCGGEPDYYISNEAVFRVFWSSHIVHCKECQARVQTTAGKDAATAMWNGRTPQDGGREATVSEFKNELGSTIRITIEGPTSKSTNDLTPTEAEKLNEALTKHFVATARDAVIKECADKADHHSYEAAQAVRSLVSGARA